MTWKIKTRVPTPQPTPLVIQVQQAPQIINWAQAGLDAAIVLVGTFLALMGAFWIDRIQKSRAEKEGNKFQDAENKRHIEALQVDEKSRVEERAAQKLRETEVKNRLVVSMLTEIEIYHSFLRITSHPYSGAHYTLEVGSIFETVPEQIRLFRNVELVRGLAVYRDHLSKMKGAIASLNSFPYGVENPIVSHIRGNWNSWWNEGKKKNSEIRNMLVLEHEGELPKELAAWSPH